MVRATHLKLVTPAPAVAEDWLAACAGDYAPPEAALLKRVYEWSVPRLASRKLAGGEAALAHAQNTAVVLRELGLDAECAAASLLAPVIGEQNALTEVRDRFGSSISALADGVARMALIEALSVRNAGDHSATQLESLRKMLLAMAQDVRVVLIKLADHVQTMRFLVGGDDAQARHDAARIALDIFAPLANRLGVWQLKWELEDLALRILEPDVYSRIAGKLDVSRDAREHHIGEIIRVLQSELDRADIKSEITGRAKHIYSIYNKMRRKNVEFDELYDVHAVRILVNDVEDCYAALGMVHNLWAPLTREFDDYIARPKSNHYRSLHTAVIGIDGKPVEIQIRTFDMHRHAELGVAAHWRYKEGERPATRRDIGYDGKIAWLRQLIEWKEDITDTGELAARFKSELFADTIYVLTPHGKVIDLPQEATPIDFAYQVHSDLGHRCRGAKVNGSIVPLNTALKNGQQVEIITAKQGGPSRDWLNSALGYVRSAGARTKIRQWFNRQNRETAIAHGREIVEKELQRHGMTGIKLDILASQFDFARLDDFLAEVGRGKIGSGRLEEMLHAGGPADGIMEQPRVRRPGARPGGILVVGVDKLLTAPAKCCKPLPPDPIIGFVTRGRGVTIHRKSCHNPTRLAAERLIEAEWGADAAATFPADVVVEAIDRPGLLRDVTEIFLREHLNVIASRHASRNAATRLVLTVEASNLDQLRRVLLLVGDVPGVARAARR